MSIKLDNDKIKKILEKNRDKYKEGAVADYIPALEKVDEKLLAFSYIDKERNIVNFGDYKHRFTIQSISKVLALMIAVKELGEKEVFSKLGYYGMSDKFNSIKSLYELEKPLNPNMNSGAILVTSLITNEGFSGYEKVKSLIEYIIDDEVEYDVEAYHSERETGHNNRAIFHILKNLGLVFGDEIKLDNYFKQCCILLNTEELAKLGFFFSNNLTRFDGDKKYYDRDLAVLLNSIMLSSGMYDYSGEFSRKVGIPSKSGVGGGILSSLPGELGIAVFSPPLDENGNSLVGVSILEELSKEFDLNIFGA